MDSSKKILRIIIIFILLMLALVVPARIVLKEQPASGKLNVTIDGVSYRLDRDAEGAMQFYVDDGARARIFRVPMLRAEILDKDSDTNVLYDTVTNTDAGENLSPALVWDSGESVSSDITEYAVYMIDVAADNWLHLVDWGLTETSYATGALPVNGSYVGPYPPAGSGKHCYMVYVFYLKASPDEIPGSFDAQNGSITDIAKVLDVSGGESGNLVAAAVDYGFYTR